MSLETTVRGLGRLPECAVFVRCLSSCQTASPAATWRLVTQSFCATTPRLLLHNTPRHHHEASPFCDQNTAVFMYLGLDSTCTMSHSPLMDFDEPFGKYPSRMVHSSRMLRISPVLLESGSLAWRGFLPSYRLIMLVTWHYHLGSHWRQPDDHLSISIEHYDPN